MDPNQENVAPMGGSRHPGTGSTVRNATPGAQALHDNAHIVQAGQKGKSGKTSNDRQAQRNDLPPLLHLRPRANDKDVLATPKGIPRL